MLIHFRSTVVAYNFKYYELCWKCSFANLALIFAIGIAVGLANGDKGTAGLAGGVAYLVYTATISGFLELFQQKMQH